MTLRRLILVSEHYEPSSGATAQLMRDLSSGLANNGWKVTVLTATAADSGDDASNPCSVVRLGEQKRAADANKTLTGKTLAGLRFALSCLLWCNRQSRQGDVMLIVSNPPFIGVIGPLLKLLRRLSYVFLFQDLFPRSAVLSGVLPRQGLATQAWHRLMQMVCEYSAATVVLNQSMARRLAGETKKSLPLRVIHNWAIEQGSGSPRSSNKFAWEHNFHGQFTVQYSGNFGRLHDIETLITSASILKNDPLIQFLFIGGGVKQSVIEEAKLKNVLLFPYQPRKRLPETLAACDLACISLISGAEDTMAPCKLYGILASGRGLVLIAKPNCDLAQLVQQERIGIVVSPGDSQHLAQQIKALSDAPHEAAAMGQRAKQLYEKRFGFERSLLQYDRLLRSIR